MLSRDKEEEEANRAVTEAATKQVEASKARVKRVMRGSVIPEEPAPPPADKAKKAGDSMMSPRGKAGDSMMSPRGR